MNDSDHKAPSGDNYVVDQWKALGGWFLGPRGENKDVFMEIFTQLFDAHVDLRNSYFPGDPAYITNEIKESYAYKEEIKDTKKKLLHIADELKNSVPFFSPRYQAHMCWDVTLPSLLGYMVAMLSNQNNVDTAASAVTTVYEKTVGLQLCDMLGYNVSDHGIKGWGHITCGGSVANIESLWAARNIKYSALAVQWAVDNGVEEHVLTVDQYNLAREYKIKVGVQNEKSSVYEWQDVAIGGCTTKQLLNLDVDEYCDLTRRVAEAAGLKDKEIDAFGEWVEKCSITSTGMLDFMQRHNIKSPVYTCPANCHYSWPKGGTLLGLGSNALVAVPLDINFRQDVAVLEEKLLECIEKEQPILSVVAVIGSTEESAVDPIFQIWQLRKILKLKHGINFSIHADAAWGGYFKTMLVEEPVKERSSNKKGFMPFTPLTKYVTEQYNNIQQADTITLDPHKSGFCPYPAGALCYRNEAMRNFIAIMHPEVFHGEDDPTMGVYGIEGSKPGAAPTGVLASHQVIGLDIYGYGRILGQCTTTAKLFYCLWLDLARPDDPFVCVPLQILPDKYTQIVDGGITLAVKIIREKIMGKPMGEVYKDEEAMDLLRECGPDTIINTFVVNLKDRDGQINSNVERANTLQKALSDELNVNVGSNAQRVPMVLMQSALNQDHGEALMQYKERIGLERDDTDLSVMVNTTMNPWQWNESIYAIGEIFRSNILNCIGKITDGEDNHEFVLCGDADNDGYLFAEYIPSFQNPSRQYQAVVKFQVKVTSNIAKPQRGMFVRSIGEITLHELLCCPDPNGVMFNLYEDYDGKELSVVNLVVVDYPRYQHFDMSSHVNYHDKQTYFIYGDAKRTYMTHCIKKAPDFMQIIELDGTPYGLPENMKQLGLELTIKEIDGYPKMVNGVVTDPLDNKNYPVVYRGREHALCSSTAYFECQDAKVYWKVLN